MNPDKKNCQKNTKTNFIVLCVVMFSFIVSILCELSIANNLQAQQESKENVIKDGYDDSGISTDGSYDTCSLLNAENFEKRLNNEENLIGCIVVFKINNVEPDGFFGYTIQAGEHLNFISNDNKGVDASQEMFVKVKKVDIFMGSYLIEYDLFKREK